MVIILLRSHKIPNHIVRPGKASIAALLIAGLILLFLAPFAEGAKVRHRRKSPTKPLSGISATTPAESVPVVEPVAESGAIRGTVSITGAVKTVRKSFNPYSDLYGAASRGSEKVARKEHLVVFLENVPGKWPVPVDHAILDQVDRQFTTDLLPVLVGTVVDFTNHDRVYHNVFTYSELQPFDLGRRARNEKRSVEFQRLPAEGPGVIKVGCEIHANMHSVILVMRNPFWAVADASGGSFEIKGVPPGKYMLTGWHNSLLPEPIQVTVGAGKTAEVTMLMKGTN